MKYYDKLKIGIEAIKHQMVKTKKNECDEELKKVKHLCKEFCFTSGILKGSLAEGRKNSEYQPSKRNRHLSN